jgi:hypothetical protein
VISGDVADMRKNEVAVSLVRRNDFKAKISELTGLQAELSDDA